MSAPAAMIGANEVAVAFPHIPPPPPRRTRLFQSQIVKRER
jgi:hypothetical protein